MQSMSVKQLLQSPKAANANGEVATEKQQGLLPNGKVANAKNITGKSLGVTDGNAEIQNAEVGAMDFSSLFAEIQAGAVATQGQKEVKAEGQLTAQLEGQPQTKVEGQNPTKLEGKVQVPGKSEKTILDKIAGTSTNMDQLLNNLKGTEDRQVENGEQVESESESGRGSRKGFFPNKKTETENPLEFLVKNTKDKTISAAEVQESSDLEMLMNKSGVAKNGIAKNEFFPNKITNPALAEKMQNQEQVVKVLSGEDFVKNLNAANPQEKEVVGKIDNSDLLAKLEKKQNGIVPLNIPQIKNYGKGQNILNDSMIRNTNDLAFKETKKLKSGTTDELRSPDMKVAADLAMIKENPIASLQLKNSPIQENKIATDTKVLDLSHIDAKNTNEIIKTISDYVEQNQVGNRSSLDLVVKHDSLGQFKIQVNKGTGITQNQVDMQITTSSAEGHKFFVAHEADLMRNLQQSGVNISDLRIVSSMKESTPFSQSESKQFSSFQHEQNGDSKQFMSFESSDFREGSQKRKSLWDEYQERYGA